MTENPEESLEREEGPTPRWETTQLGLIGPIGFTCSSLRSFILIFVIYLAKVPARSTSTALCNWVPGGEAVVLIGHTWLFHRWVIYLRFGEPGDKEEVKQRGLQDKARREGARGKEAVCLAPLHFGDESQFTGRTKHPGPQRKGWIWQEFYHRGNSPQGAYLGLKEKNNNNLF